MRYAFRYIVSEFILILTECQLGFDLLYKMHCLKQFKIYNSLSVVPAHKIM